MKTAREEAITVLYGQATSGGELRAFGEVRQMDVDALTAAIEARDAQHEALFLGTANSAANLRSALKMATEALEEIAEYDTDFAKGPADNVGALQTISERALSQISKLTQVPRG